MAETKPEHPAPDYLPTLDGLRGIAVLLVMLTHLSLEHAAPALEAFKNGIRAGYTGVDIFFVLSGFLVTRILIHDWYVGQPLGRFLWRRALRIFPAYYLLLAVLAVAAPGRYLIACLLYLSNFTDAIHEDYLHPMRHAWSLAIEEQFYLFWPALFHLAGANKARLLSFALLPAMALATFAVLVWVARGGVDVGGWIYRLPTTRILSLSFGCSLAFLEPSLRARRGVLLSLAIGVAAAGGALAIASLRMPQGVRGSTGTVAFALISCSTVLAGLWLHKAPPLLRGALANRVLRGIGRISYGLYLYHFPIYLAFGVRYATDNPSVARILAAVATSFAAAIVSWHLVERPILRRRDRIPTPWAIVRSRRGSVA